MKINFDQLFSSPALIKTQSLTQSESRSNFKKASHTSQASTALGFEQIMNRSRQRERQRVTQNKYGHHFEKQNKNNSNASYQQINQKYKMKMKDKNQIRRVLQNCGKDQGLKMKYFVQAKFDQQPDRFLFKAQGRPKQQQKSMTKGQIDKLTNRLHNPQKCNKKCCKQAQQIQSFRKLKQQLNSDDIQIGSHKRSLTETCEYFNQHPSSPLHDYLYFQHKAREFRQMELKLQYEEKFIEENRVRLLANNRGVNANYVPFYDRLDQEIQKRVKKQQFYNKNVVVQNKILNFHPDISISQRSLQMLGSKKSSIPTRKPRNQLKGNWQMKQLQKLHRSLTKSVDSIMNRSVQIVQNQQDKFISKLVRTFQQGGKFVINPSCIQNLDQIQFQKFFPLIQSMQDLQGIQIKQFQETLRQYFKNLPNFDKLALRKHTLHKQKSTKLRVRTAQTMIVPSSKILTSRTKRERKDYLEKINQFI